MTKNQAIKRAGNASKLALILGLTRQAVYRWPGNAIPDLHNYRLMERRPEWFISKVPKDEG